MTIQVQFLLLHCLIDAKNGLPEILLSIHTATSVCWSNNAFVCVFLKGLNIVFKQDHSILVMILSVRLGPLLVLYHSCAYGLSPRAVQNSGVGVSEAKHSWSRDQKNFKFYRKRIFFFWNVTGFFFNITLSLWLCNVCCFVRISDNNVLEGHLFKHLLNCTGSSLYFWRLMPQICSIETSCGLYWGLWMEARIYCVTYGSNYYFLADICLYVCAVEGHAAQSSQ